MKPKTFEDFFGSIDFRDRSVVGDQVDQHAIDVATECRAMMERTAGWLTLNPHDRQTETHNLMSDKMAARIAKDFGMVKCAVCGRYDFEGVERCLHPGCGETQRETSTANTVRVGPKPAGVGTHDELVGPSESGD